MKTNKILHKPINKARILDDGRRYQYQEIFPMCRDWATILTRSIMDDLVHELAILFSLDISEVETIKE